MANVPVPQQSFLEKWQGSSAAERANYQHFLIDLCDFLDLPRPHPTVADEPQNTYVFEKAVTFHNPDGTTSPGRIDLYRGSAFILEAKQGSNPTQPETHAETGDLILIAPTERSSRQRRGTAIRGTHGWDSAMRAAYFQAERYAKALPAAEGWPPFLITVDVGHSIELFADFSLTGKAYLPFPDPRSHRLLLPELAHTDIQARLRAVWQDPLSLDPARRTAKVTREIAGKLANLARNLERNGHAPKQVAEFLTRCIFTSFAEDVNLLIKGQRPWLDMLRQLHREGNDHIFPQMATSLWDTMNAGGFSPIIKTTLLRFNGGLFENTSALPLTPDQLNLLIEAADSCWRDVEPAIFGTLLERALDPNERHALGAHYTPRAYVERLVIPTLVEPLRADWANTQAAAQDLLESGKPDDAIAVVRSFHTQLCDTRVLDPACGSGNFLYVALEHLKRLEGEVLETLVSLGETQQSLEHTGLTVDPHQLLGIELNPRAAVVADLVLWIGYLQWHFRTRGDAQPPIPVIKNFHNIEHRDALLTWKQKVPAVDENGQEITPWNGVTFKDHPTTGRKVPDETARRKVFHYLGAKQATWPEADFILGNPPFIGGKDIRSELGDGYVEVLRKLYTDVPDSADYVMYWWQRAASLARHSKIRRFGLITTNSLPQVFNRRVVSQNLNATKDPLSLIYAIPDHPWLKALATDEESVSKAAAVRIAMTVGERGEHTGQLLTVLSEGNTTAEGIDVALSTATGRIFSDLRLGVDISVTQTLEANDLVCTPGVKLHGSGFIVTKAQAANLGLGRVPGLERHIRTYMNGRDLMGRSRDVMVIDLQGLSVREVSNRYPEVYQWVLDRVKPERDHNREAYRRDNWWVFGRKHTDLRTSLAELPRFISTVETAKHRIFVFLDAAILPDNKLVNVALSDAADLGILSSRIHLTWASANRALLEDRPVYVKTTCFDPFPFPTPTEAQRQTIRDLGERLDAHRKRQQQLHPSLTLTGMYNVLGKLRASHGFTEEDLTIYNNGLIGILREIHDDLDRAVFAAYDWPSTLTDDEILARLIELNVARRAEEAAGHIRWLRPDFQAPAEAAQTLPGTVAETRIEPASTARRKKPWPSAIPAQFSAVRDTLRTTAAQSPAEIASNFRSARRDRVTEILQTLTALGQVRADGNRYSL